MKKNYYITTTLPYVNAEPHIGFAREIVQADALARFQRLLGKEVFFNTGTDEHGQKILEKAEEKGMSPQAYADEIVENWRALKEQLNLSYNRFIRTTDEEHIEAAREFWRICNENSFIYKKNYKAKYCVGCELIKTDSELEKGECPDHPGKPLEVIEEENYFFKFSQFAQKLLDHYRANVDFVKPDKRYNEIKKFVERGLEDFSISRLKERMPWGIEVPDDSDHVMYVWFDALVNYISALGWPNEKYKKFWDEAEERVQFCGKDNLRQQSAMWQAMLMSAGLPNSTRIFINGFINVGGQKMSKTLGNVISPNEMIERYGTDGTRYLLLSAGSFGEDTDITWEKLDEKYNADLANGLGNLLSRVITLSQKGNFQFSIFNFQSIFNNTIFKSLEEMEAEQILKNVWQLVRKANQYIEETKPWELAKENKKDFEKIILKAGSSLAEVAAYLEPLLPETSEKIKKALQEKKTKPLFKRI